MEEFRIIYRKHNLPSNEYSDWKDYGVVFSTIKEAERNCPISERYFGDEYEYRIITIKSSV